LGVVVFRRNRQFLIAYTGLVIAPLFGLGAVLKCGRTLIAPPSLNGVWEIKLNAEVPSLSCPTGLLRSWQNLVIASQSGKTFSISVIGSPLAGGGLIEGNTLIGRFRLSSEDYPYLKCGNSEELDMQAVIDPASNSKSFTGTLSLKDCSSCAPVHFRAIRMPVAKTGSS
jgi:hypothetical protein